MLKDVRYVSQLKKNVISRVLEAQGLRRTLREDVLKMFCGSLVVLKSIRCNNLYYLKGSAVTKNLAALENLDGDSTMLWHSRLGHVGLESLKLNTRIIRRCEDLQFRVL